MSPRRITVSQSVVNTAPAFKDTVTYVSAWNSVAGAAAAGGIAYRIIGEAPIDGYLDAAYLILDNLSSAAEVEGQFYTITLVNVGDDGQATPVTMTTAVKTDVTRQPLSVVTFPIILAGNARKVEQGDIITLKAVNGTVENPGATLTGLMTLQFSASRSGS